MSRSTPDLALSTSSLPALSARGVPVPTYDRTTLRPRIVHIGVGGFHRAHLALYTDELAAAGSDWGIRGVGMLAGDRAMAEALRAQDLLYTLTERGSDGSQSRVIGSIVDYVLADSEPRLAVEAIADPETAIVSLTITESGYTEPPAGTIGVFDVVAEALDRRRAEGLGPVTILSCDNLPGNGVVARRAMLAATARRSDDLQHWVATRCTFPNSMVDRITPATSEADRRWLVDEYGIVDRWPVVGEPFRQWVIEDDFAAGRPAWEDVGALFTPDVHSWELYKLRFLNAGHSSIAYLCALAGITFVDEALADPAVNAYLTELLVEEALPTVHEIPGYPREDYIRTVLDRFANTGVRDQIARLCIDGSAKYPTFLLPTIVRQLELGGPIERATLALAGWARYLAVVPAEQQSFDATGDEARAFARAGADDPVAFLEYRRVFPDELRTNERFRRQFAESARALDAIGPRAAMMGITSS